MMPLEPKQLDTALAILSDMIAGLYRERIADGSMTTEEYRQRLYDAQDDRDMNASVFAGPLAALYHVAQRR